MHHRKEKEGGDANQHDDRHHHACGTACRWLRSKYAYRISREAGDEDSAGEEEWRRPDEGFGKRKELWHAQPSTWSEHAAAHRFRRGQSRILCIIFGRSSDCSLSPVVASIDDVAPSLDETHLAANCQRERHSACYENTEQRR